MSRKRPMNRVQPVRMCRKHPAIPAVNGKDLCTSCLAFEKFGKETVGKAAAAAGGAKK